MHDVGFGRHGSKVVASFAELRVTRREQSDEGRKKGGEVVRVFGEVLGVGGEEGEVGGEGGEEDREEGCELMVEVSQLWNESRRKPSQLTLGDEMEGIEAHLFFV